MTKSVETTIVLSHDHLVQAVRDYLFGNTVLWPFPDNSDIVDIDFGMALDDPERYNLEVTLELGEDE